MVVSFALKRSGALFVFCYSESSTILDGLHIIQTIRFKLTWVFGTRWLRFRLWLFQFEVYLLLKLKIWIKNVAQMIRIAQSTKAIAGCQLKLTCRKLPCNAGLIGRKSPFIFPHVRRKSRRPNTLSFLSSKFGVHFPKPTGSNCAWCASPWDLFESSGWQVQALSRFPAETHEPEYSIFMFSFSFSHFNQTSSSQRFLVGTFATREPSDLNPRQDRITGKSLWSAFPPKKSSIRALPISFECGHKAFS